MVSNAALKMAVGNEDESAVEDGTVEADQTESERTPEEHRQSLRMVEAMLFASAEPLAAEAMASRLPDGAEIHGLLRELQQFYSSRGVHLVQVAGKWAFRTADDLSFLLSREASEQRKLSRAALETLAIIAYHQPVTRAEIEEIRGVATSSGTIDVLLESGWVRMRGRRKVPGRPITYGTTESFLSHFGLDSIGDLPGVDELKAAGLLDSRVPPDFTVPEPHAGDELRDDEDPLEDEPSADGGAAKRETVREQDAVAGAGPAEAGPSPRWSDADNAAPVENALGDQRDEDGASVQAAVARADVDKKTATTLAAVASAIAVELDAADEVEPRAASGDATVLSDDEAVNGEDRVLDAGNDIAGNAEMAETLVPTHIVSSDDADKGT